jgi:hypothetical protein
MSARSLAIALTALAAAGCADNGPKGADPGAASKTEGLTTTLAIANGLVLPSPEGPVPIRVPAQVMRIWIAPWEDDHGDLHAPGYLYTEIAPRRWTIGEPVEDPATRRIRPLQIEPREDAKATPRTGADKQGVPTPQVPTKPGRPAGRPG